MNSYAKFHENPTNDKSLKDGETNGQTDRCMWSPHATF